MPEDRVSLSHPLPTPSPVPQDFAVPAETVPLPSQGKVYPTSSPLYGLQTIDIRAMTARDEDVLTSRALLKSGRAISTLIQNCVLLPGVDASQMLSGDRNAILIGIRISGYGQEYKIQMLCPSCGEKVDRTVDLAELPIRRFPEGVGPVAEGTNEFAYKLPSGKQATFKLMTGADEHELLQIFERSRKNGIQETLVTTRLCSQLLSLNGERDRSKLPALIRNLPARDSHSLRTYIDRITPCVDLRSRFVCPACDHEGEEVEVPLGTEFFWPRA